ncbi:uncharacterized protein LOC115480960 [Microcaecilia unicolor]|uniref:Uncharacterized protein LOC115480960 n=1 Tax=Microcaecilia unicolor TaxID=1415580 RepID=A0A6P7ZMT4_9AMPH|nr:uncharacterized protein LOC115480960 [Microcaecilia unicolor]
MSLEGFQQATENPLERSYNRKKCQWKMKFSVHELNFLKSLNLQELMLEIFSILGAPIELELDGELHGTAPSLEDALEAEQLLRGLIQQRVFLIPIKNFELCEWHVMKHWLKSKLKELRWRIHIDIFQNGDTGSFQVVLVGFKDCFSIVENDLVSFLHSLEYTTEYVSIGSSELLQFEELQSILNLSCLQVEIEAKFDLRDPAILFHGLRKDIEMAKGIIAELIIKDKQRLQKGSGMTPHNSGFHWTGDSIILLHRGDSEGSVPNVDVLIYTLEHSKCSRYAVNSCGSSSTLGEITGQGRTLKQGIAISSQTIISHTGKLQRVIHLVTVPENTEEHLFGALQGWEQCLTEAIYLGLDYTEKQGFASLAILCLESKRDVLAYSAYTRSVAKALEMFSHVCPFPGLKQVMFVSNQEAALSKFSSRCQRKWRSLNCRQIALCPWSHEGDNNIQIDIDSGYVAQEKVQVVAVPVLLGRDRRSGVNMGSVLGLSLGVLDCLWDFIPEVAELHAGCVVVVPTEPYTHLKFQQLYLLGGCVHDSGSECLKKAFAKAIRKCLDECDKSLIGSLAIPILGQRSWPLSTSEALRVALEEISCFERQRWNSTLRKIRLLLHPEDQAPPVVHQEIAKSFENLGLCVMEDKVFVDYLTGCTDAYKDFCDRLKPLEASISAGGTRQALQIIALVSEECCKESLRRWTRAVLAAYEIVWDNYIVHEERDASMMQLLLSKHGQLLNGLNSVCIYEQNRLIGHRMEVLKLLRTLQDLAFNQELVKKQWRAGSWATSVIVLEYLRQEGQFPNVRTSHEATDGLIILEGPREMVSAAEQRCNDLVNAMRWEELLLTGLQASFLRSMNEEVFTEKVFFANEILVWLQVREQIKLFGMTVEEISHAKSFLEEVISEEYIYVPNSVQMHLCSPVWLNFMDMLGRELNQEGKTIEIHTFPSLSCPTQLVLVGFRSVVFAGKEEILKYMNWIQEQVASLIEAEMRLSALQDKNISEEDREHYPSITSKDQENLTANRQMPKAVDHDMKKYLGQETHSSLVQKKSTAPGHTGKKKTVAKRHKIPRTTGQGIRRGLTPSQVAEYVHNHRERHSSSSSGEDMYCSEESDANRSNMQFTSSFMGQGIPSIANEEILRELVQEKQDTPRKKISAVQWQKTPLNPEQQIPMIVGSDISSTIGQEKPTAQKQNIPTNTQMKELAAPELELHSGPGQKMRSDLRLETTSVSGQAIPTTQILSIPVASGQHIPKAPEQDKSAAPGQKLPSNPRQDMPTLMGKPVAIGQEMPTAPGEDIPEAQGSDISVAPEQVTFVAPEEDMPKAPESDVSAAPEQETPTTPGLDVLSDQEQEMSTALGKGVLVAPEQEKLIATGKGVLAAPEQKTPTPAEEDMPKAPESDVLATLEKEMPTTPGLDVSSGSEQETPTAPGKGVLAAPEQKTPTAPEKDMPKAPESNLSAAPEQEAPTAPGLDVSAGPEKETLTAPRKDMPKAQGSNVSMASEKETPIATGKGVLAAPEQEMLTALEEGMPKDPESDVSAAPEQEMPTAIGLNVSAGPEKETFTAPGSNESTAPEQKTPTALRENVHKAQGSDVLVAPEQEMSTAPENDMPKVPGQEIPTGLGSDVSAGLEKKMLTAPGEDELAAPEQETPISLQKGVLAASEQETSTTPDEDMPKAQESDVSAAPEQETSTAPESHVLVSPEQETHAVSGEDMPKAPELDVSAVPELETPTSTEEDVSATLEQEMPTALGENILVASEQQMLTATEKDMSKGYELDVLVSPEQETLTAPVENIPKDPESDVSAVPEHEMPTAPGEDILATPEQEIHTAPGEDLLEAPDQEMPIAPGEDMPKAPELDVSAVSEQETPTAPEEDVSAALEQEMPTAPGENILAASEKEMPTSAEEDMPKGQVLDVLIAPEQETLTAPVVDISKAPESDVSAVPEHEMLTASGEDILAAPEHETPTVQGEDVSATPEQEMPTTPGEDVKAAPVQETPTVSGEKMPRAQGSNVVVSSEQEMLTTPGEDMPKAPESDVSAVAEQEMPTTSGEDVMATPEQEIDTAPGENILAASEKEMPTSAEEDMPKGQVLVVSIAPEQETLTAPVMDISKAPESDVSAVPEHETPTAPGEDILAAPEHETSTAQEGGVSAAPEQEMPIAPEEDMPEAQGSDVLVAPEQDMLTAPGEDMPKAPELDVSAVSEQETPTAPEEDVSAALEQEMPTALGENILAASEKEMPTSAEEDMPKGQVSRA